MSLLPENSTQFERDIEAQFLDAFGPAQTIPTVWTAEDCPVAFLPYLAWSLAITLWDDEWSEEEKRDAIARAIFVHRHRGTVGAINRAVESLGLSTTIQRWFEYEGDPYTFRVSVDADATPVTIDDLKLLHSIILDAKAARSHLDTIDTQRTRDWTTKMAMAVTRTTVREALPVELA